MLALFGYVPGEIILEALKDGEPLAYVLVTVVVAVIVTGLVMQNAKQKTTAR